MIRPFAIFTPLVVASFLLSACGAPAPASPAPEATIAPTNLLPLPTPTEVIALPTASDDTPSSTAFTPLKLEAPDCNYGGEIKSIEALDELIVKITLCKPDVGFPAKIASPSLGIQPREHLEAAGGAPLSNPTGTGPYKLFEWRQGEELLLTRFDSYYGQPAKMPRVVFRWQPDAAIRLLELQSGTIDGMDELAPGDLGVVEADPNLRLVKRPGLDVLYLGMNTAQTPLDNEKVRQALAMSLDRNALANQFSANAAEAASHFAPCAIPNGCAGEAWYEPDLVQAKELLKQAQQETGIKLTLTYAEISPNLIPSLDKTAAEIKAQLKAGLDIDIELVTMQPAEYLQAIKDKKIDGLYLLAWNATYPDQADFLNRHFDTEDNPFQDLREALQQAAIRDGQENRRSYYEQANKLLRQHVPVIPLIHSQGVAAFKEGVQNPQAAPLWTENFAAMQISGQDALVWMQRTEPASLYCADETNPAAWRVCSQITETLLRYQPGTASTEPGLAVSYAVNVPLTEWTFSLRPNVLFHDGSSLDANDVVTSFIIQWDAANPLHKGNTGAFYTWRLLFGNFLNQK